MTRISPMKIGEALKGPALQKVCARRLLRPLICCLLITLPTPMGLAQKAQGGRRQYIYSLSQQASSSRYLGITGIPAYISYGGINRRGIYVTGTFADGPWRELGLTQGTMLLSLDNRVMDSPRTADNYLSSHSGRIECSMVVMRGGAPQVVSNQFQATGGAPGELAMPSAPGTIKMEFPGGLPGPRTGKKYTVSELEKYGLQLINDSRRAEGQGAGSVSEHPALTNLARTYAESMLRTGHKSHYDLEGRGPQERAKAMGIKVGVYENFTWDGGVLTDEKALIADAHNRMMSEPKNQENHRYNILLPSHQYVGVGIAKDGHNIYMVHEFSDSAP